MNKQADLLRFIELYKSREVLWNMNAPIYRRNDLKVKAYDYIAAECKMSTEDVKKKIKSLRTVYGREKAKLDASKRSGCDSEAVYQPSVFWYSEMAFIDATLIRRKIVDNSNQVDLNNLEETTLDFEVTDNSSSTSSQAYPKKRKAEPEPKSNLDDMIAKLLQVNKAFGTFEVFAESVSKQLQDLPLKAAYEAMSKIQAILTQTKVNVLETNVVTFRPINQSPRTSTPFSQISTPLSRNDVLLSAMSDADITEEDL